MPLAHKGAPALARSLAVKWALVMLAHSSHARTFMCIEAFGRAPCARKSRSTVVPGIGFYPKLAPTTIFKRRPAERMVLAAPAITLMIGRRSNASLASYESCSFHQDPPAGFGAIRR